jgi:hypothetical protein
MSEHVTTGLVKRRSELAGQVEEAQAPLRQLLNDIDSIDATLRIFQPDIDLEEIKPIPLPPRFPAYKGEIARIVLTALRQTMTPMTTRDLTLRVMTERGLNLNDKKLMGAMAKRTGACLEAYRNRPNCVSCHKYSILGCFGHKMQSVLMSPEAEYGSSMGARGIWPNATLPSSVTRAKQKVD